MKRTVDIWRMVPGVTDVKLTGADGLNPGLAARIERRLSARWAISHVAGAGAGRAAQSCADSEPAATATARRSDLISASAVHERARACAIGCDRPGRDAVTGCRSATERIGTAGQGWFSLVPARSAMAVLGNRHRSRPSFESTTSSRNVRGRSTRGPRCRHAGTFQFRCRARRGLRATRAPTKSRCPTARRSGARARIRAAHC